MNNKLTEEILEKFPELILLIEKLRISESDRKRYSDTIFLSLLSACHNDKEALAVLERIEYKLNEERVDPIQLLGVLSRLKYKFNKRLDDYLKL